MSQGRRAEIEQREYDPRREERRKASRLAVPDDVDARMLDAEVRRELRSLTRESAELVARHLVQTGRLLDDDPERALAHARAARAMAGRVGVVREAAGLAAYAAGEWSEALAELRAARRITGRPEHLGVMADCERALQRPERALAYADDRELEHVAQDQRVELVIVLAGARRDLGQLDAAVLTLQDPARRTTAGRPWAARLWYAYADALLTAGRVDEARTWFERAAEVDVDGETDAGDRLLALDGVVLEDLGDDDETDVAGLPDAQELADVVAQAFPRPGPAAADPEGAPTATTTQTAGAEPVTGGAAGSEEPPDARQAGQEQDADGADRADGAQRADGAAGGQPQTDPQPGARLLPAAGSLMPQFASPPPVPSGEEPDADDDPR